jgi:hypothetical protein
VWGEMPPEAAKYGKLQEAEDAAFGGSMAAPALPLNLTPSVPKSATPQQCIAMWVDLTNACEQLLIAGLRREIGPDGDLKAACGKWYAEQMEEHDRTVMRMLTRMSHQGGQGAR